MKKLKNQPPVPPVQTVDSHNGLMSILIDSALHGHQPSVALMASLFSTLQTTTSQATCQSVELAGIDYRVNAANDDVMTPIANSELKYGTR